MVACSYLIYSKIGRNDPYPRGSGNVNWADEPIPVLEGRTPRRKNAAQFPTGSRGTRWACSDSPSLLQPRLECLGQPLQNGGLRQR